MDCPPCPAIGETAAPAAAKPRKKRAAVYMPPACRAALSTCMKGARKGSGTPKTCMVEFNRCRKKG